jgi:hypothetical protein
MRIRSRVDRLTRLQGRRERAQIPYVVSQREGESLDDAKRRALAGRVPPPNWCFVLAPEPMSLEEWLAKAREYSAVPEVQNPVIEPDG